MQGDILFYKYRGGLFEWGIAEFTHSAIVHVEIEIENGFAVGALGGQGIIRHPIVSPSVVWSFTDHVKDTSLLQNGLNWLTKQVGREYGLDDIITAGLKVFLHGMYIGQIGHYDCSDLATRFLIEAGAVEFLGDLAQEPHTVTPGQLAKQLLGIA